MTNPAPPLQRHPISSHYPVDEAAIARLRRSMEESGFVQERPIILYEGKILDGWLRHLAATQAGVTPAYKQFEGTPGDAARFVRAENFNRVNLSKEQQILLLLQEGAPGKDLTVTEIAKLVGCSDTYVRKILRKEREAEDQPNIYA